MSDAVARNQLAGFVARYAPGVAQLARRVLSTMRSRLPGAWELVYDNYNGLAVVYGPTEKVSDGVFSIVLYPGWVSLFFTRGAELPDPEGLLCGTGKRIRHIVVEHAQTLDAPGVRALMEAALGGAKSFDRTRRGKTVIKSVSPRQRPRRPVEKTASARKARR
jgi:hypothetical protein